MSRLSGIREVCSTAHIVGMAAYLLSGTLLLMRVQWAAWPMGLFVASCLLAPFFPGAGYFLPVISRGPRDKRAVALTFDDGPDPQATDPLLELLRRQGVQATFFVVGRKTERHPELVRAILSAGHTIGNHSYRHDPFLMLRSVARLTEEIARTQQALAGFGVRPLVFRPPVGITSPRLPGALRQAGLACVTFSCRAGDFGNRRIAGLADRILKKIHPGAIVLLHDVPPTGRETTEAWLREVERIIEGIRSRGYAIVPLPQLIGRPVMKSLPR